jgi:hypothetical protein
MYAFKEQWELSNSRIEALEVANRNGTRLNVVALIACGVIIYLIEKSSDCEVCKCGI